jgi:TP901 family phage tail tape measure protein
MSVGGIIVPVMVVDPTKQADIKKIVAGINAIQVATKNAGAQTAKNLSTFQSMKAGIVSNIKQFKILRWAMVDVAFGLTLIGGIASPFVKLTKDAMAFEHQLTKVSAVTGATENAIKDIVVATREGTPFTIKDTTEAFLQFSKAGFTAAESTKALKSILDLSLISGQSLGDAASRTAQIIRQFGLQSEDSAHIVDILSSTADNTRASVEGLGNALAYAGAIAGASGQSFENTVASLALLTNAGLDNQKSGTALRQIYASLIDPSQKAQQQLNKLGVSLFTASGEMKPLTKFMEELYSSMEGFTTEEMQSALGEMFDVRALAGVEIFIAQLKESNGSLEDFIDSTQKVGSGFVKSFRLAHTELSTWKDTWESIKTSFLADSDNMAASMNRFADSIKRIQPLLIGVIDITSGIVDGFSRAVGPVLALGAAIASFVAFLGGGWVAVAVGALAGIAAGGSIAEIAFLNSKDSIVDWGEKTEETMSRVSKELNVQVAGYGKLSSLVTSYTGVAKILNSEQENTGTTLVRLTNKVKDYEGALLQLQDKMKNVESDSFEESQIAAQIEKVVKLINEAKQDLVDYTKTTEINGKAIEKYIEQIEAQISAYETLNASTKNLINSSENIDEIFDKLTGAEEIHETTKAMEPFIDIVENMKDSLEDFDLSTLTSENEILALSLKSTVQTILDLDEKIEGAEESLAKLKAEKIRLKDAVDSTNDYLSEQKDILKDLTDRYNEVEKKIKSLSKVRFKNESETITLLQKAEIYQKKNELASLGIADAQDYINDALKDSNGEYDKFFDKIMKINGAMNDNTKSFEAWQESIKQAIKSEVESGQELEADVTDRVKKWQTELLGTSKFSSGSDLQSPIEDFINKLQLASDVNFGGMRSDVESFEMKKVDEAMGMIPETSQELISALRTEYDLRDSLSSQIIEQESVVNSATKAYEYAITTLNDKIEEIEDTEDDISKWAIAINDSRLSIEGFALSLSEASKIVSIGMEKNFKAFTPDMLNSNLHVPNEELTKLRLTPYEQMIKGLTIPNPRIISPTQQTRYELPSNIRYETPTNTVYDKPSEPLVIKQTFNMYGSNNQEVGTESAAAIGRELKTLR